MAKKRRKSFLACPYCNNSTAHTLLCSEYSDFRHYDSEGFLIHEPATFNLFRCNGCIMISMYIWSALHNPYTEFGKLIYPDNGVKECGVPDAVETAYIEADRIKWHSNAGYAVLARKVLEIIVKDRGITARNLANALTVLADRGEIPPLLVEAANLIRIFGNTGAHSSIEKISGTHVQMIEMFLETLIKHIYITPSELKIFKIMLDVDENNN